MVSSLVLPTCKQCQKSLRSYAGLNEGLCKSCFQQQLKAKESEKAKMAIRHLLEREDVLILDTETNGTGAGTEVIELSVINTKGDILLDTLIRPKHFVMNPWAQNVHGIRLDMLKDAPDWTTILPQLAALADRRTLLAWNAPFDARMLEQTSEIWNLHHPRWLFVCAMRLYAKKCSIKNRGLHKVVVDEGLEHLFELYDSHRALGDIKFVLEVLRKTSQI